MKNEYLKDKYVKLISQFLIRFNEVLPC